MNRLRILQLLLLIFLIHVKCEEKRSTDSKQLPYFRRKVEELDDANTDLPDEPDDAPNIVSILVKNVKEIFDDADENSSEKINNIYPAAKFTATMTHTSSNVPCRATNKVLIRQHIGISATEDDISINNISTSTRTNFVMLDENLPYTTLRDRIQDTSEYFEINQRVFNPRLSKDLNYYAKVDHVKQRDVMPSMQPFLIGNTSDTVSESGDPRRSCIMCNNVVSEDCNDPKNKLIPSIMCDRDDDLCYSLHTPFGIIDRGCFNVNHNLTTYVCSCNLCNYISISDMPFMFIKKRDWVDNVIELSRTKHLRNSIFKDMSCLRCEVNTTTKTGDMLDSANCLEGNIGNLPVEDCDVDEVCAVKAHKADGYIWRGCLKNPLYNYWFTTCDRDLCNYDTLVALYDFVI